MSTSTGRGRWVYNWNPDDENQWRNGGRRLARRNLLLSIVSEHIGFSVWSLWSVLVLFMSPEIGLGFGPGEKFLLVVVPTVVGAVLRLPYSCAVTRFGGRDWTVFSTAILLVPTLLAAWFVRQPGTDLWVFLLIGALAGLGGGNFASSMTNVAVLYPRRLHGWALGLNAAGGNLGVAAVHLVGLLVIATAGDEHPSYVAAVYLPLIVVVALVSVWRMDNVDAVLVAPGALREAAGDRHTLWLCLLYVGTFGSFVGFGFAFGLVLRHELGFTALAAASYTFLGPLLGSLSRPAGGWAADRWGGARVTLAAFAGMAAGTAVLLAAASQHSFALLLTGFVVLFVLSGAGNGAVYRLISTVFAPTRLTGAVMGITGAVGALGGAAVNVAFLASYGAGLGGGPAFLSFLGYYGLCGVLTWLVYLRHASPGRTSSRRTTETERHPSRV